MLVAFLLTGCGSGTPTNKSLPGATVDPVPSKALPPEYQTLVENLSLEMKSSPNQYRDNKSITELMSEGHRTVMALRGIHSSDPDIAYIAKQGDSAYSEALNRLERINALPKPPDAEELFFSSFIDGFFGNFSGGYSRGRDAENKQNAIIGEAQALVAAIEKADTAHQLLTSVAEKYSAPLTTSTGRIRVDFDESWGWWGPHDWFSVHNNGPALQDCTIAVQMTGAKGDVRKNVHYVKNWPNNSWLYGRYERGQEILGRKAGRMTVYVVQKVDVTVYSPKFATVINYVYQGAEKDKKIAEKCKDLKVSCRYQPFDSGFFSDTQRGALLTLDGVPFVGKCRVDVTFSKKLNSERKAWYWEFDSWKKGEQKVFAAKQLTFDPDNINVVISFPGTYYQYPTSFSISR
jgi:hypothetical protein